MGRGVRALLIHAPLLDRRSDDAREAQPRSLPRELLHDGALRFVPEPPLAPGLDHRVLGGARGVVLPLLLPRRALGGVGHCGG